MSGTEAPLGLVEKEVTLAVGREYGTFGPTYPADCEKSERILEELCDYLVEHQGEDGSWQVLERGRGGRGSGRPGAAATRRPPSSGARPGIP